MAKGKTSTANKANEREKVAEKKVSHQKSLTKANKWDFKHLTDEQKKLSIYGIIVILIVIVIIIAIFSFNSDKGNTPEEKTENYLEKTVRGFYEDYYYEQLVKLQENEMIDGDVATFLSNFTTEGIPVSINVMINNKYIGESEIEEHIGEYRCDYDNTIVRIYPTSPYGKQDYTLKTTLDCEKEME
ncbi:MAG TPA: hypothetical protein IAB56_01590 [Candidatus Scybalousia intestinigallinarum]|nr:hypothetical protein [Candidatus Scybalousia intestinigallinarum]